MGQDFDGVQKIVNLSAQTLLSFEKPAYKVGPWLASGKVDLRGGAGADGGGSHHSQNLRGWLTGPWLFVQNNVISAEHLLSFWEAGILEFARERVPT